MRDGHSEPPVNAMEQLKASDDAFEALMPLKAVEEVSPSSKNVPRFGRAQGAQAVQQAALDSSAVNASSDHPSSIVTSIEPAPSPQQLFPTEVEMGSKATEGSSSGLGVRYLLPSHEE